MVDSVGTTRYTYNAAGQILSEDGPWNDDTVNYSYANRLRSEMRIMQPNASPWVQSYAWDAAKRLTNLISPAGAFGYTYDSMRNLQVKKLLLPNTAFITNSFDVKARVTSTVLKNSGGTSLAGFTGYGYDSLNLRSASRLESSVVYYDYDAIGQLIRTTPYDPGVTLTNRFHESFGYRYDAAGNLNYRTNNALIEAFNVNPLNELTTNTRSGTLTVAGTTTSAATNVTVNTSNAVLFADYTFASSNQALVNGSNTFAAIAKDTYGRSDTNISSSYLPSTNSFAYDLNGNLRTNGQQILDYDDENQLTTNSVPGAWKSEFVYDGKMRRRICRDYVWQYGAWHLQSERRYVYDGNLPIQDRDANNLPQVSYTRGRDLGRSLQGAGGIGGLLARTDLRVIAVGNSSTHAYFFGDGNGNITAMINTNQQLVAKYLYDPFGNTISKSGALADANLYRFSSKENQISSGMYYYGYRFYDPLLHRWINQDPNNELGFQSIQVIQTANWNKPEPVDTGSLGSPLPFKRSFRKNTRSVSVGTETKTVPKQVGGPGSSFIGYEFCRNDPMDRFDVNGLADAPIDAPGTGYFVTQIGIGAIVGLLDWGIYNYACSDIPPDQEGFLRTPGSAAATIANLLAIGVHCGSAGGLVYMHIWSDRHCGCHRNYVIICNGFGPSA
jgi:RHS repeat-associated protein